MLELIILVLTVQWVLGFFGHSLLPGTQLSGVFTYVLSFARIALILIRFAT